MTTAQAFSTANVDIGCSGPLWRETEFSWIASLGRRVYGACGPNGLASAASSALGRVLHTSDVYMLMRAHGLCDDSGASTMGSLQSAAILLGCKIAAYRAYSEPWSDFLPWCVANVEAGHPTEIEVANGQALVDLLTNAGENAAHLQYHFITLLIRHAGGFSTRANRVLPAGFFAADGDNFAGGNNAGNNFNAANVLQFYPDAVLAAARPCAGLALLGGVNQMAWVKQADGSGKDARGNVCGAGDMEYLTANGLTTSDGLMKETFYSGVDSFLPLTDGRIVTAHKNADGTWAIGEQGAQALVTVWNELQAAKSGTSAPPEPSAYKTALEAMKAALALV